MNDYNKIETDSQIERTTSGYPRGEDRGEGQVRGMGLTDTNYYI